MKKIYMFILTFILCLLGISVIEAKDYTYSCKFVREASSREYYINFTDDFTGIESCSYKDVYTGELTECNDYSVYINPYWDNTQVVNDNSCPLDINVSDSTINIQDRGPHTAVEDFYAEGSGQSFDGICKYKYNKAYTATTEVLNVNFTISSDNHYSGVSSMFYGNGEEIPTYHSVIKTPVESPGICPKSIDLAEIGSDYRVLIRNDGTGEYKYYPGFAGHSNTCPGIYDQNSCETAPDVACVWVDEEDYDFLEKGYCNVDNLLYVGCGGASDIPMQVPGLISLFVNLLKIATPIILIFVSIITLMKALAAGKEDEIKKATSSLIKKIIAAAMVFFVIAIVQFVVSKMVTDDQDYEDFSSCLNCFLNNECENSVYYKTVISGTDYCTPLGGQTDLCNK